MKIDCIADLHGEKPKLEGGDLLIIAGDLTASDKLHQYEEFNNWCGTLKYEKIIVVAGNHDMEVQKDLFIIDDYLNFDYLQDSSTDFKGLKIWGSPWTFWFHSINRHCTAFTKRTEDELNDYFRIIPDDTDIVVTHMPMFGIFDETVRGNIRVGSTTLRKRIETVMPRLHVCGHIHENHGMLKLKHMMQDKPDTICVCASIMNEDYDPVNKPIRIEL